MPKSLSIILLAYNEASSITMAVDDIHRFCRQSALTYEIIIVDDGSSDQTGELARHLMRDNVRLISHARNLGMGASMQDGYNAAICDYMVALPGDRQLRADSLSAFLPHATEDTVVLGRYPAPHSGRRRALMSKAFREFVVRVGRLTVDVSGAYLFSRRLYQESKISHKAASNTFLYSFQLLESFKQHGARFAVVEQVPFCREFGTSRVARPGRILKIAGDILKHRFSRN